MYDSNKNTFNEINGFYAQNPKTTYWNGKGIRWQDGYGFFGKGDSFGKGPKGIPYFESSGGMKKFWGTFDLSVTAGKSGFPYGEALSRDYSRKCGGSARFYCSEFKLKKSDLTGLSTNTSESSKEKICLTLTLTRKNMGTKKGDCVTAK